MRFTIDIELGNDAMRSRNHVANALRKIADKLIDAEIHALHIEQSGKIMDLNGNSVGLWAVTK